MKIAAKWIVGLIPAVCPLIMLEFVREQKTLWLTNGSYQPILLTVVLAFASCFIFPLMSFLWAVFWWDRVSLIGLVITLGCAFGTLAYFYFDPGHHLASFMAD